MKLTKEIRENIIADVVEKTGLNAELKAAQETIKKEAVAEWERGYPEGLKKYADWISVTQYAYFVNGAGHCLKDETLSDAGKLFEMRGSTPRIKVTDTLKSLFDYRDEIVKRVDQTIEVTRAVVYSCSTRKQLIETAPELEPFIPEEQKSGALVDMATLERLRAMLGGKS